MTAPGFETLRRSIISCRGCPRLVEYRERVPPTRAFAGEPYWRRPVPGFGDLQGRLLILGLAPARNGANRTGRIFTGDASSRFLVSALHSAGFANQPTSEGRDDGLSYADCFVTAAVKCAPPGDRPLRGEFENCAPFLDREISLLPNLKAVLALGSYAFRAYLDHLKRSGVGARGVKFGHGKSYRLPDGVTLYGGYHPSPRNTNTGKLTMPMLLSLLNRIREDLSI